MQQELTRSHRAAFAAVAVMFAFTLLLMALAMSGYLPQTQSRNPVAENGLRIAIVLFGLGAVTLRRTKFSAMRLQDIAALRGATGLLATLQKTTIYVALIGGSIALMGFIFSIMSGDGTDMLKLGVVAVAVLLYAFPRRGAWERVLLATQANDAPDVSATKRTVV
ncbi:MAG: hypothetical protein WKF30_03560 [Pyrinomonadaceae bacterium]